MRPGAKHSGIRSSFKLFLELEPQVRDIIFKFYESKYASCLKMLDEMKVRKEGDCWAPGRATGRLLTSFPLQDNLLLDMYLAPHVRTLYTQIRNRALIQVSTGTKTGQGVACPGVVGTHHPFCSAVFQPLRVGRHAQDGRGVQHHGGRPGG